MRKTLFATAALAALAFAGAASAQNAHTYTIQTNNAGQNSTLRLDSIRVGSNLTGSATSIGNIIDISVPTTNTNQAIAELNSGNGLGSGPQFNNGAQTSNLSAINVAAPGRSDLNSTSAGNVVNLEGQLITQRGNATFSQINNGPAPTTYTYPGGSYTFQNPAQSANLNVSGGSYGEIEGSAGAIGNILSAEGGTVLLTPARIGSTATANNYIPTDVLGQAQTNNGAQYADVYVSRTSFATGSFDGQAVGNSTSIDASLVANVGGHQTNNGAQQTSVNLNFVSSPGATSVNGLSIGNSTAADAPTVTVNGYSDGFGRGDSSIRQINNTGQSTNVTVNSSNLDRVNASAASVGNILSLTGGSVAIAGSNSQVNNGFQQSSLSFNNVVSPGTSSLSSQTVGNVLPLTLTGGASFGFDQTNNAGQNSYLNVNNGSFGTVNASSLSMANSASIVAPTGFIGGMNQTNNAGQFSTTNVNFASFSNLTAGAASVGNSFSVTTGPARP